MNRSDLASVFTPEQIGKLIVQPVEGFAIATQVATVQPTSNSSFKFPIVTTDPAAGWTAEGAEITPGEVGTDEQEVVPKKLAGLSIISNELANDSSPAASSIIGEGLARDIAKRLDEAFFGSTVLNGPNGLESLVDELDAPLVNLVDAGAAWADLDPFNEAIYAAEGVGGRITAFCANPADALALAQLKEASGSNRALLQPDPTQPTRRMIAGVPLYVSPAVTAGTIWGVPGDLVYVVRREDTTLAVDRSRYFEKDSVGIRATMRAAFGYPHPSAIQKIVMTPVG